MSDIQKVQAHIQSLKQKTESSIQQKRIRLSEAEDADLHTCGATMLTLVAASAELDVYNKVLSMLHRRVERAEREGGPAPTVSVVEDFLRREILQRAEFPETGDLIGQRSERQMLATFAMLMRDLPSICEGTPA